MTMQVDKHLLAWVSAFAIVEPIFNSIFYILGRGVVAEYYRKIPSHIVVLGDLSYSTVIFLASLRIFKHYNNVYPTLKNWKEFILILIIVQWLMDLTWAFIVYNTKTKNKYIDFFKRYASSVGAKALVADSIYLIFWSFLYLNILEYTDAIWQYLLIFLGIFIFVIFSYD
jgi:hypothetical protein